MAHPLTGRRSRGDLIAELYDRHGTGLFAYCLDQLGDPDTAAEALLAVFANLPPAEPPRASLYAAARREILRRDVVRAPTTVDPLADPANALVERTLAELRPHQREVLLLTIVCGLTTGELGWVLDVASDTADELTLSACHSFTQAVTAALTSAAATPRLPQRVAEIYGALGVASIRDTLACLPWSAPPAYLRAELLRALGGSAVGDRAAWGSAAGGSAAGHGGVGGTRPAAPFPPRSSVYVKSLWPTTAVWPLPLSDNDPATSTALFPADLVIPPPFPRAFRHDAATEPLPRYTERDPLGYRRHQPAPRARHRKPDPLPDPVGWAPVGSAPVGSAPVGSDTPGPGRPFVLSAPVPADVLDAPDSAAPPPGVAPSGRAAPSASLFTPPVYILPPQEHELAAAQSPSAPDNTSAHARHTAPGAPSAATAPGPRAAEEAAAKDGAAEQVRPGAPEGPLHRSSRARSRRGKPLKPGEHRFDWTWEIIGFAICIAIALIVFFSVPMIVNP
ncbi:DNA-directed RNA polymerase specialized sigma subunit, sigma24 family [Sinosporangium album]|uniref:DNA-directed RNA polymerase specialized sigma subunit, sigma24 family n=1 Tax=Sinosporangium album TaxID=504805 RepID=A0A1G8F3H1_9ACTN|nr:sigma-70 family RNA polymerase sigma factor [Sinosporangium album]SDH76648.1 DNA-directed RNA polymerase specialized sigma subunit, sigma24 family [Sinosporangium album]